MKPIPLCFSLVALLGAILPVPARGEFRDRAHPFMLWTPDEAAAIRRRIDTQPWAQARYEAILKETGLGKTFRNLFRYQVMGDAKAGEAEKKYLLHIIGTHPRDYEKKLDQGGRHYDCYLDVLRYDIFYDQLTPEQRKGIEDTFRTYIDYHLADQKVYTRTSWLPNMQWPRPIAAHLMAVGLKDEKLIRTVFASNGGWKYYFDDYIADGTFYMEEFGKHYSMIGEMFLWCRAVERLGLDELGYGYTGKHGATMRRYVESIHLVGLPRIDLGTGRAHYPKLTMGDAKGGGFEGAPPYLFQHYMVAGHLPNGAGGNAGWTSNNMNGRDHFNNKVDKMAAPLWFELAHARWPDAGFDYFLAQMRSPDQDQYYPTLYFGLDPIDPARAKAPPAPSYLAPERGFVMLRGDESPAYWHSPAPAVGLQLATYYVHYVHDAFSLLGYYAFNRPVYFNRGIANGYAGGDPWTDSTRGHCGVMVDNLQYQLNDADPRKDHPHWPAPIGPVPTRSAFDSLVKFVIAHGKPAKPAPGIDDTQPLAERTLSVDPNAREKSREIFPGVAMTRALFLTNDYLFDVYQLAASKPRRYDWHVHALGAADPQDASAWQPTDELDGKLYDESNRAIAARFKDPDERQRYQLREVRKLAPGSKPWSLLTVQTCALPDPSQSVLGKAWYDRKVGVRIHMLGEEGTRVYFAKTPEVRKKPGAEKSKSEKSDLPNEVGGVSVLVSRTKPSTTFVALHEPFENARPRIAAFTPIQQTLQALGVSVIGQPGTGINDRLLLALVEDPAQTFTLASAQESFTFADRVYLRIRPDQVEVSGSLKQMKLKVNGSPRLLLNGQAVPATVQNGLMSYGG